MSKVGWFEITSSNKESTPLYRDGPKALMVELQFFAYTDERIKEGDDTFYPDAMFELSEMYDDLDEIGYWALFTVEMHNTGRWEMGDQLTDLWRKMDEPHAPQLSDFLDMCHEYFDEGRTAFHEMKAQQEESGE